MKKPRKLRFDDRSKLLLSCAAVTVLLLAALLLPLAFRGEGGPAATASAGAGEKRRLFADYWMLDPAEQGITVTREETLPPETVRDCEAVMRRLVEYCIDDRQFAYAAPDGSEYTVIRDGSGTQARLCRMWLEARGDWQSWLDVCFDAESGEVYYLYISRECLSNRTKYESRADLGARDIAERLAEAYGWTLRWLDEGAERSAALFTAADGTACYQIECSSHDTLLDVKLCCR